MLPKVLCGANIPSDQDIIQHHISVSQMKVGFILLCVVPMQQIYHAAATIASESRHEWEANEY